MDLCIIGAGGQGRVAADIALLSGRYARILFLDDSGLQTVADMPVVGTVDAVDAWLDRAEFFVAVGNNAVRRKLLDGLQQKHARIATLCHKTAVVASRACIGEGAILMANSVVGVDSHIGRGAIINTAATVDHDGKIGDCAHISPGAHLAGNVAVGEGTWVGVGAIVRNDVSICAECMIGAGAVVVCDIDVPGVYMGVPARCTNQSEVG